MFVTKLSEGKERM